MPSFLNVIALALAVSLPSVSQTPIAKPETPIIISDTNFALVGSLHGQAREVPVAVTTFRGVVPAMPERWPKVYAFTLGPKEKIRVKVVESTPRQVHLMGATPESVLRSKKWTDLSVVSFFNTFEKSRLFYVLVRGGYDGEECQYTLAIERENPPSKIQNAILTPQRNGWACIEGAAGVGPVLPQPYLLGLETKYQSPFRMNLSVLNLPWWNSAERARVEMVRNPRAPSMESFPGRPNLGDPEAPQFPRPLW